MLQSVQRFTERRYLAELADRLDLTPSATKAA
jgi:uncharacterized membrane protein YebE (DUF533 family)